MKFMCRVNETVVKVALVAFNFIFSILSIALVALGVVYMDELSLAKKYAGLEFLELPTMLIALGSLSFVASLVGCYCARHDRPKLMKLFIVVLCILLALELTVSLISFINLKGSLPEKTRALMKTQLLSENFSDRQELYEVESFYDCCGVEGAKDYLCGEFMGESCCQDQNGLCTEDHINATDLDLTPGCAEAVASKMQQVALEVACYSTAMACLRVLEVTCLFMGPTA